MPPVKTSGALIALALVACKPEPTVAHDTGVSAKPDATAAAETAPPGPKLRSALPVEMWGAANRLSAMVKEGAADSKNAWMLAHGLLAFGKEMKASDGRLAIDVIVEDFVQPHQADGKIAYYS